MGRLDGKIALVTGASGGQGAATARAFVAEGAQVVISDVDDDAGKRLADELGSAARYFHLDVSQEDEWAAAVEYTAEEFGAITVLVNNAGILHFAPLADTKLADYQRLININQVGCFLGMRAVVKQMTEAGGGSIINVSSIEGLRAAPLLVAYTASKFAIRGMTKVAALELGRFGIRANSVHPGMIETNMLPTAFGGVEVDLSVPAKKTALRRIGQPEEIAALSVFLASDESSYCTGAEFTADGGATATHVFGAMG